MFESLRTKLDALTARVRIAIQSGESKIHMEVVALMAAFHTELSVLEARIQALEGRNRSGNGGAGGSPATSGVSSTNVDGSGGGGGSMLPIGSPVPLIPDAPIPADPTLPAP